MDVSETIKFQVVHQYSILENAKYLVVDSHVSKTFLYYCSCWHDFVQLGNDKRQGIPNTSLQKKYGFEQQQQTTTTTTNNNNTNTLSPKCIKIPILGGKMVINYGKLGCNVFMQTQTMHMPGCLFCALIVSLWLNRRQHPHANFHHSSLLLILLLQFSIATSRTAVGNCCALLYCSHNGDVFIKHE